MCKIESKTIDKEKIEKILKALEYWESAADLIVRREGFIYDLESFERLASDPNRYFVKGHRGSSAARQDEAVQREKIYKVNILRRTNLYSISLVNFEKLSQKKIDQVQKQLETLLSEIEKVFGDCVRYNGRSYADKMKWDRIEMLHYLAEKRRMKYFKHEVKMKLLDASSLAEI